MGSLGVYDYECLFIRFDDPGHAKSLGFRQRADRDITLMAKPGEKYTLPGWFIKNWNFRKQIYTNQIPRALFWFQPTSLLPKEIQRQMASYAKESGIYRHTSL